MFNSTFDLDVRAIGGVILEASTGVHWSATCGGHACEERSAEGVFIPQFLPEEFRRLIPRGFMDGLPYYQQDDIVPDVRRFLPPDIQTRPTFNDRPADLRGAIVMAVDHFRRSAEGRSRDFHFAIDPARLDKLTEAFVPVVVDCEDDSSEWFPLKGRTGWLVYTNSD